MSGQILGTCMIAYSTFFAFINVTAKRWRQGCVISTRGPQKPAGPILYFWGQILNQFKGGKGEKMIGCTGHHHYHKQSELQWRCTKKSEFDWQRERERERRNGRTPNHRCFDPYFPQTINKATRYSTQSACSVIIQSTRFLNILDPSFLQSERQKGILQ